MHEFVIILNGELKTYSNYEDIPEQFNNLIKFKPVIPEPPHEEHQHDEIGEWNQKLQELMKREKNASRN